VLLIFDNLVFDRYILDSFVALSPSLLTALYLEVYLYTEITWFWLNGCGLTAEECLGELLVFFVGKKVFLRFILSPNGEFIFPRHIVANYFFSANASG
jgi:hypothetical protein